MCASEQEGGKEPLRADRVVGHSWWFCASGMEITVSGCVPYQKFTLCYLIEG